MEDIFKISDSTSIKVSDSSAKKVNFDVINNDINFNITLDSDTAYNLGMKLISYGYICGATSGYNFSNTAMDDTNKNPEKIIKEEEPIKEEPVKEEDTTSSTVDKILAKLNEENKYTPDKSTEELFDKAFHPEKHVNDHKTSYKVMMDNYNKDSNKKNTEESTKKTTTNHANPNKIVLDLNDPYDAINKLNSIMNKFYKDV